MLVTEAGQKKKKKREEVNVSGLLIFLTLSIYLGVCKNGFCSLLIEFGLLCAN